MDFTNNLINKNTVIRRAVLAVLVLITYIFQETGGLFPAPAGIHAILLIPLTVCIAMFEREFAGIFFGLLAGAMLDAFNSDSICFSSVAFTIIGFSAGALITYLMRNNLVCAAILTALSTFIYNSLYFIFYCVFDGEPNPVAVYFRYFFLSVIYTAVFTPLYYFIVREITRKLK